MSDLIDREEVIDAICNKCMLDHKMERRMSALCRNCRTVTMIQAIPSADVVSLEEFEQMRFLADKSMEMLGEPTWTDVLAELHDRFDALEKEIRKASAEMSAIIREYVDRPKGEWMPYEAYLGKDREYSVTEHKCSLCGYLWGEPEYRYCPNCGADMRPKGDTDV